MKTEYRLTIIGVLVAAAVGCSWLKPEPVVVHTTTVPVELDTVPTNPNPDLCGQTDDEQNRCYKRDVRICNDQVTRQAHDSRAQALAAVKQCMRELNWENI